MTATANPRQKLKEAKRQQDLSALVSMGGVIFGGISVLLNLLLLCLYFGLLIKPPPSLVQLPTGETVKVRAMGNLERDNATIQRFTTDALSLLMSWNSQLPPTPDANGNPMPTTDPGIEISVASNIKKRIPSTAFQAGFTFSESFRQQLLNALTDMVPSGVLEGKITTSLVFEAVTVPEKVSEGKWKLKIIANLLRSDGTGDITTTPFSKEIIVRAIDTPPLPADGKFASPLDSAIWSIRQSGLEIESMVDLDPGLATGTFNTSSFTTPAKPVTPTKPAKP